MGALCALCSQRYLLLQAKPGAWEFHSSVLTSQSPQEICNNIIREKILEYLPLEVPYSVIQVGRVHEQTCLSAVLLEISDHVLRIPLFEFVKSARCFTRPRRVTWNSRVRCWENLWVFEGATLVCLCLGAELSPLRQQHLLFLRRFAELLSLCLLFQVTEMWEEGPSGELLIAQKLLVPRKSHMVSNRRET